ncbi:uncharacterized protein LOC126832434 [Patella vulgata]|uniref:uncharacterized protein LOC126832434 n=1 Tax=Patella vulgata TaxID=6465 RepID=UPI0024A91BD6|nr:uncharacterized protein LOC126832434 [Patella vulgata]
MTIKGFLNIYILLTLLTTYSLNNGEYYHGKVKLYLYGQHLPQNINFPHTNMASDNGRDNDLQGPSRSMITVSRAAGTSRSDSSSMILEKQTKAETARAKAQFAEQRKTVRLKHANAELDAELEFIQQQTDVAVAEAEVRVFQSHKGSSFRSCESELRSLPRENTMERTQQFVDQNQDTLFENNLTDYQNQQYDPYDNYNEQHYDYQSQWYPSNHQYDYYHRPYYPEVDSPQTRVLEPAAQHTQLPRQAPPLLQERNRTQVQRGPPTNAPSIKTDATAFSQPSSLPHATLNSNTTITGELSRFLLKKDLLLSRFTKFNDQPESYAVWKSGFLHIKSELQVTTSEEMDLLIKWLGLESSRNAISLKAANVSNPARGLARIWERLDERYGSPELVEASLKNKLANFPKLYTDKDNKKLFELSDIISEIESAKEDPMYASLLAYFDSSSGVIPIVNKLPRGIQEKWTGQAVKYKKTYQVPFPPFSFFAEFIRDVSKTKNDPSFAYDRTYNQPNNQRDRLPSKVSAPALRTNISTRKTEVKQQSEVTDNRSKCPIHHTNHSINECNAFRYKPISERKAYLKTIGFCYRCCATKEHLIAACTENIKCDICNSNQHASAMHVNSDSVTSGTSSAPVNHGGERTEPKQLTSKCTQVCSDKFRGKSCAKIIQLKVYQTENPVKTVQVYGIFDDQSNRSLGNKGIFDSLEVQAEPFSYTLSSCAGTFPTSGRKATGITIESLDGSAKFELPQLIECDHIPAIRDEIPSPEVALHHSHLQDIAEFIPPVDDLVNIQLLIGRDLIEAHHVLDQRIGPRNSPYAQQLPLGWVIIGEACLGNIHKPEVINVNKTHTLPNGRNTLFEPCPNNLELKDLHPTRYDVFTSQDSFNDGIGEAVFRLSRNDEKLGPSVEDREFLVIMDREFQRDSSGNWVAPLPFKENRPRLPNNRTQAANRAKSLDYSLRKDSTKRAHFFTFMKRVFDNNHAELAPPLRDDDECWYLPIFGVYHPKKKDQIRAVFDSSAQHENISLNNVMLTGPDLTNSLLGVLLRFRKHEVGITADIQQMFHCFLVQENHRNFLRFLWYKDNIFENEIIEYRMRVHVFGNSPSPAVATYGLRRSALIGQETFGIDVKNFVDRNFYVDDGLASLPTSEQAIDLMKRTQKALLVGGNLHLHKIASNSPEVMEAFATEDLAKDLKELNFSTDSLPIQRSLGLAWNLTSDTFTFQVSQEIKPFTRRGILSTINSLFDPFGFVAPVVIQGKILLRNLMSSTTDWDEPLPTKQLTEWDKWRCSLQHLDNLRIPRMYSDTSYGIARKELHIYSDASEKAVAAVAYMRTTYTDGNHHVGFILGKAKLAPTSGHTIPRLELCAAVLAVEIHDIIQEHLDITPDVITFHTDSKVVLGYIYNRTRRFYLYVTNRIDRIRKSTIPLQWQFIPTDKNPADLGTRSVPASDLEHSVWRKGPTHLYQKQQFEEDDFYELRNPEEDSEVRPIVTTLLTTINKGKLGIHRFERFSSWKTLTWTISRLIHIAQMYHSSGNCKGWHVCNESKNTEAQLNSERFIIKQVQLETYGKELIKIKADKPLPKDSTIITLDPVIDEYGLLRVGGRLSKAELPFQEKSPIILPASAHISTLIIRHHHELVQHQGRHFTEGAVRAAGFWIVGGKRLISSIIFKCVKCRKLRGKQEFQKMSDLPGNRLKPAPPFTYVGVDTFGPWSVVSRRTRGHQANSKRWAIIFTCLTTRAIHLEVIEDMGTSGFINALRRFIAIRGNVSEFRSDRGTNFIGTTNELNMEVIMDENGPVINFLNNRKAKWIFNPPHSSHMGGVWERMIGITRRILDSMLAEVSSKYLTHEVLVTFMAEVTAIVNARPIVPVSTDTQSPAILSPQTLLTQKVDHITQPLGQFNIKDLYKSQWRAVQSMADTFWNRWRREFLHTLQPRRKWQSTQPNLKPGDVVLLKDNQLHRNDWPIGMVEQIFPGDDNNVRKVTLRIIKDGEPTVYTRPVTELVLLDSETDN